MARRSRAAREDEMRVVLARWQRSGLPLSRFADREGVVQETLYRWRRRLGIGADGMRRGRRVESPDGGPGVAPAAVPFEVVLGDGPMVRVPDRFDPEVLRILLETRRGC